MLEAFERAILEDSEDEARYRVYADWLTGQGDPRGELIQIQLNLEDASLAHADRDRARAREQELLAAHGAAFLGALAGPLLGPPESEGYTRFECQHRFRRGFLDTISASVLTVDLLRALRASPETRFLQRLSLLDTAYIEDEVEIDGEPLVEDQALIPFLEEAPLENLREFQLGGLDPSNCHTNGEGVASLLARTPRLESLHLEAHGVDCAKIFGLPMPRLRSLLVHHVHDYPLSVLAQNASLENLEVLRLHPHAIEPDDDEAYLDFDDVCAVATSPHLARLRHLEMRLSSAGDEGIDVLIEHGVIDRLAVLDLKWGEVTDRGAKRLAAHPGTRRLERLELSGNQLTSEGVAALKNAGIAVACGEQFPEGDPNRAYLFRGDFE